jgi:hypothetical protein
VPTSLSSLVSECMRVMRTEAMCIISGWFDEGMFAGGLYSLLSCI